VLLVSLAVGLCVLVELGMLVTRGHFQNIFLDFDTELPVISTVALGWVLPTLLATVILAAISKEYIPAMRQCANGCNCVVVLIGVACMAIYVAGIAVPALALWNGLS
jgi:hypothetical protein